MKLELAPLNTKLDADRIRAEFTSCSPLPGFAVVPGFLDETLAMAVVDQALSVRYATWCGYSPTGRPEDVRSHFREPDETDFFVTVHQRPTEPVPLLDAVGAAFARRETIARLARMTGLDLKAMRPFGSEILTRWPQGAFLDRHNDAGPAGERTQLVISLSLTKGWREDFGGSTVFHWEGAREGVTTWPVFNTAVLFRAHAGSTHWVTPVRECGDAARLTFTLHFV